MRTLIASIFALLSLTMVSCSDGDDFYNADMAETTRYAKNTRALSGESFVRFAMYHSFNGYNVRVKNMRLENGINPNNGKVMGTAIADADCLPSDVNNRIYDNANGEYNTLAAPGEDSWVVVHFDVVITSDSDFDSKMVFKDVKYYISPSEDWEPGGYYDYTINLDSEFLGLSEITFGASVEDFQDGNDADVDC